MKARITLLFFFLSFVFVAQAFAQAKEPPAEGAPAAKTPAAEEEEDDEAKVLQRGVVASFGSHKGAASINANTATEAAGDNMEESPVRGSVRRVGSGRCEATLTSSAEKAVYSVSFAVVGTTQSGTRALRRTYSATIRPGKSTTKTLSCRKGLNMALLINSGRRVN